MQNTKKEEFNVQKFYGEDCVISVEDFKNKYAKAPLKKEKLTFELLREWFLQNGNL